MSTVRIYKGGWLQIIRTNYDDVYLVQNDCFVEDSDPVIYLNVPTCVLNHGMTQR